MQLVQRCRASDGENDEQLELAWAQGDGDAIDGRPPAAERPELEPGRPDHRLGSCQLDFHQASERTDGRDAERIRPVPTGAEVDHSGDRPVGQVHGRRVADPVAYRANTSAPDANTAAARSVASAMAMPLVPAAVSSQRPPGTNPTPSAGRRSWRGADSHSTRPVRVGDEGQHPAVAPGLGELLDQVRGGAADRGGVPALGEVGGVVDGGALPVDVEQLAAAVPRRPDVRGDDRRSRPGFVGGTRLLDRDPPLD